ncbi:MAG TPA: Tex-like N-terminal domain-containing protein, partial [Polyangiaceae bacterium]|nr:Tex-like N-terminal domain-containing protein [Polyangiaceae bacterium]
MSGVSGGEAADAAFAGLGSSLLGSSLSGQALSTRYDAQIEVQLAAELSVAQSSVRAVIELQAEGATVPFIARYRKEKTGGLDEVQIRTIFE